MIDCDLTVVTQNMPLFKLNKTTSHKEQEHGLLFNLHLHLHLII